MNILESHPGLTAKVNIASGLTAKVNIAFIRLISISVQSISGNKSSWIAVFAVLTMQPCIFQANPPSCTIIRTSSISVTWEVLIYA